MPDLLRMLNRLLEGSPNSTPTEGALRARVAGYLAFYQLWRFAIMLNPDLSAHGSRLAAKLTLPLALFRLRTFGLNTT